VERLGETGIAYISVLYLSAKLSDRYFYFISKEVHRANHQETP
jgi:hypothetical protein